MKYQELFAAGNAAQLEKLKANEHKAGSDDIERAEAILAKAKEQ